MTLPAHWVDGEFAASVAAGDRGLAYGDGLFETFRVCAGKIHLWSYHWQRLQRGLDVLQIECDRVRVEGALRQGLDFMAREGIGDAAGRLTITRGVSARGYASPAGEPTLMLSLGDISPWGQTPPSQPARLCRTALAEQPLLAGLKHCNRLEQVLAARELAAGEAGVQLNSRGELVCAVSANLFFADERRLVTPPLETAGVAGTVRQLIIEELAPRAGQPVQVCNLVPGDIVRF